MRADSSARPILVADPDDAFLDELQRQSEPARLRVRAVSGAEELARAVLDAQSAFSAVLLNPRISESRAVVPLVRLVHEHRPVTPVFFLHEKDSPCRLNGAQLQSLAVQKALTKPVSCLDLRTLVAPLDLHLTEAQEKLLESTDQGLKTSEAQGLKLSDEEFFPVRSMDFLTRTPCFFDVFIRLSPGHYVKVLQAGDFFSSDQLGKYLARGVSQFHIRKSEYAGFLHSCDEMASVLIESPVVPASIKVRAVAEYGEEMSHLLRENGVSEAQIAQAQRFVEKVDRLVTRLDLRSRPVLESFLRDVSSFGHSVSTTMVAALICESLDVTEAVATEVVGLGALLHDIGLYSMPPEIQHEDEARMPDALRQKYRTHPLIGAQMLQGIQGIEAGVIDIVRQHHERRNLRGFPVHFGVSRVNRLAEVVGLADEFSRVLALAKKDPSVNVLHTLEREVFEGFSRSLVDAFREYFFRTLR